MRPGSVLKLLVCMWFAFWAQACAAESARVTIAPQVSVKPSKMVRLGDMASIQGPQDRVRRLNDVEIARAPGPGASREVTIDWIRSRIQCAGIETASVRLTVGKSAVGQDLANTRKVTLIGRSQTVSGVDIANAARQAVLDRAGAGVRCETEIESMPSDLSVPVGSVELVAHLRSQSWPLRSGRQWVNVGIVVDAARYAESVVAVTIRVFGPVLVAAQAMRPGDALTELNTRVEERELTGAAQLLTQLPVSGAAVAARALAAGTPITTSAITTRPCINKSDPVLVMARSGGVKVTVRGTAAADAAAGSAVRVILPWSKEEIQATVIEPGLAEVRLR